MCIYCQKLTGNGDFQCKSPGKPQIQFAAKLITFILPDQQCQNSKPTRSPSTIIKGKRKAGKKLVNRRSKDYQKFIRGHIIKNNDRNNPQFYCQEKPSDKPSHVDIHLNMKNQRIHTCHKCWHNKSNEKSIGLFPLHNNLPPLPCHIQRNNCWYVLTKMKGFVPVEWVPEKLALEIKAKLF